MTYHPNDKDDDGVVDLNVNNTETDSKRLLATNELDLPEYDDVSNAPQNASGFVWATGNGTSAEGVYVNDGGSYTRVTGGSGALVDSGTDTDSGDDYQMPKAADNIDLQSDGAIQNADSVSTDALSIGPDDESVGSRVIESQSPSGVSSVDFTTGIDSDHGSYIMELESVVPATDDEELFARVSTDGGSTWQSDASDYKYALKVHDSGGGSAQRNSDGDSKFSLTEIGVGNHVGSSSGEHLGGTLKMFSPNDSSLLTTFSFVIAYINGSNESVRVHGSATYATAETVDGVQLFFDSGNIESGSIKLLGVE